MEYRENRMIQSKIDKRCKIADSNRLDAALVQNQKSAVCLFILKVPNTLASFLPPGSPLGRRTWGIGSGHMTASVGKSMQSCFRCATMAEAGTFQAWETVFEPPKPLGSKTPPKS